MWRQEYITILNTQDKWRHSTRHESKEGDIVLIHEFGTTSVKYSMGMITEIQAKGENNPRNGRKIKPVATTIGTSQRLVECELRSFLMILWSMQRYKPIKESFHASTKDNRSFLGLLLLSGYHCLANAKYHLTAEPDLTEDGAAELTRLHDDLSRHFLELRALGKDVGANLSGFHALLPMIKRKLSPDTLEVRRSFVQYVTDEQIISVGLLPVELLNLFSC
ncbi:hypothetical protein T12_5773 [Trichinella patagoniensis]|uniref:DUF5641 domain-containing protein n=1 Tax=Trichinella patagoniensis TaxID=990121 RepID=A0A0V0ZRN4_9BILA|nr:hypothetical protein T12_5773 [Trichinella patagoniensis]